MYHSSQSYETNKMQEENIFTILNTQQKRIRKLNRVKTFKNLCEEQKETYYYPSERITDFYLTDVEDYLVMIPSSTRMKYKDIVNAIKKQLRTTKIKFSKDVIYYFLDLTKKMYEYPYKIDIDELEIDD